MATAVVVRKDQAEYWAERISDSVAKSVEAIVETGRELIAAKESLRHGEWGRMFEDGLVPFGERSAQRLMGIASHVVLSNPTHVSFLPPSWGTLYELTKVPELDLKRALSDGTITPDMPRKAVAALLQHGDDESPGPFDATVDDLTLILRKFFDRMVERWPMKTRDILAAQLRVLADEVESLNGNG